MQAPRPQPGPTRPVALVVSDAALTRHRLARRLGRAGADASRAVDPWRAADEIARRAPDVVVWSAPAHEALARELLGGPAGGAIVLVAPAGAAAGRIVAALEAGFADVVRADARGAEVVARALAVARRAGRMAAAAADADALRALVDASPDILARVAPDGSLLHVSAAVRDVLGDDPGRLAGARAADLWHPDDRERTARALEGDGGSLLHRVRRRGGGWVWLETTARALRDDHGRLRETHTDSRDVTERVRAEAEREALARVTAAVAAAAPLPEVAGLVAGEAAALCDVDGAAVVRFAGDEGVVVAAVGPARRAGDRMPLATLPGGDLVLPVVADGRPWGMVHAPGARSGRPDGPRRARPLADLLALAVANARARERLVALATTDGLTGLANRRVFHERLAGEAARARRAGRPLSLVMIDLDHFKAVNDTHGHQAGDEVLRAMATRLRETSRAGDVVARFGGEEMAWLLPDAAWADALEAAERLRSRIRGEPVGAAGRVTASLGVAEMDGRGPEDLVRRADLALYRAKAGGRDRCVAWATGMEATAAPSG
ncbi:GGDEF domain-containing protein [Miltoncostaea marina]|uniref:GGDEF domain-containing protein n=1 Tax=Miltoncostaea marina TaxID=2843215 RepID=UPI001C3DF203|nr:diguanylate cyclase [Miltoncostaea marina]